MSDRLPTVTAWDDAPAPAAPAAALPTVSAWEDDVPAGREAEKYPYGVPEADRAAQGKPGEPPRLGLWGRVKQAAGNVVDNLTEAIVPGERTAEAVKEAGDQVANAVAPLPDEKVPRTVKGVIAEGVIDTLLYKRGPQGLNDAVRRFTTRERAAAEVNKGRSPLFGTTVTPGTITNEEVRLGLNPPKDTRPPEVTAWDGQDSSPKGGALEVAKALPGTYYDLGVAAGAGSVRMLAEVGAVLGVPGADELAQFTAKQGREVQQRMGARAARLTDDAPSPDTLAAFGPDSPMRELMGLSPTARSTVNGLAQMFQQLPSWAIAGLTRSAPGWGMRAAAWMPFAQQVAGPSFQQAREAGLSLPTALGYTAGQTAAEILPEKVAFDAILKTPMPELRALRDRDPKAVLDAIKVGFGVPVLTMADEPISTFLNWAVDKYSGDQTATLERLIEDEKETIKQVIPMMAGFGAAGVIVRAAGNPARSRPNVERKPDGSIDIGPDTSPTNPTAPPPVEQPKPRVEKPIELVPGTESAQPVAEEVEQAVPQPVAPAPDPMPQSDLAIEPGAPVQFTLASGETVTGVLEDKTTTPEGWQAGIRGEDGQPYIITEQDGIAITPAAGQTPSGDARQGATEVPAAGVPEPVSEVPAPPVAEAVSAPPAAPEPAAPRPAKAPRATVEPAATEGEYVVRGDGGTILASFRLSKKGRPTGVKYFFEARETRLLADEAIATFKPEAPKAEPKVPAIKQQLYVERGGQRFPVADFAEASKKWDEFRRTTGAGLSQIGNGARIVDQDGTVVARISYNGRVWAGEKETPDEKPIYEPEWMREAPAAEAPAAIEPPAAPQPPAPEMGPRTAPQVTVGPRALTDITVNVNAMDTASGKRLPMPKRADVALAEADEQLAKARALLECLQS